MRRQYYFISLLLFLVLTTSVSAQPTNDKFQNSLIDNLIRSAEKSFENKAIDSSMVLLDSARELIGQSQWPTPFSKLYFKVTKNLFENSFYEKAYTNANLLLEKQEKQLDERTLIDVYEIFAASAGYLGDFDISDNGFSGLFLIVNNLDEDEYPLDERINLMLKHHFGRGILHAVRGEFEKGLTWFLAADSLLQIGGSEHNKYNNYTYLGNIYAELQLHDKAIFMFEKVEDAFEGGMKLDMKQIYDNLALCHTVLKDFDRATNYLDKGLALSRAEGDSFTVGYNFLNRGHLFEAKGDFDAALDNIIKAIPQFEFARNEYMVNETKSVVVGLANRIGKTEQRHLDLIEEVVTYYSSNPSTEKYIRALRYQANAALHLKQYEYAAASFKELDSLSTVWLTDNYKEKTADLETQYRTNLFKEEAELQKREAQVLQLENDRKNGLILFFVVITIVLLITAFVIYKLLLTVQASRKKIEKQNSVLEKREEEKSLLLRELHHRVKNNLQIVSSLLYLQSISAKDQSAQNAFKDGQNRVDAMAMIHRYLYTSEELTQVDVSSYLSRLVESIAYSYSFKRENLKFHFDDVPKPIDVDIAIPLGLIANELVSNAFKHAFSGIEYPLLTVSLKHKDGIELEIMDNGKGMPTDQKFDQSFGMELVHSLTKQLGATLDFKNDNGTHFKLFISKNTKING